MNRSPRLVTLALCSLLVTITVTTRPLAAGPPALALRHLWTVSIRPNADSSPAYDAHVRLAGGRQRAVVFALAGNNTSNCDPGNPVTRATLYAFDAATGRSLWSRATSGPSRCTTAGPVVDPSGRWVYAPGLDGKLHRYNAGTGAEYRQNGWPVTITLMPDVEKMAATPTTGNGYVYVTTSGFIGDAGHYQGHLVTINLRSGAVHVFNSLCSNIRRLLGPSPSSANYCSDEKSGLFGRGQGVVDPVSHAVYVVSGNGPWNGRTNWGDSVLKLDASGSRLLDAFTPANQSALASADADLGSTGPALLPPIRQGGKTYHLLVQGGKGPACGTCSGVALRLLNRDNLSGRGGLGHVGGDLSDVQTPGGCEVLTAPAVFNGPGGAQVYYANDCGLAAYRVTATGYGAFRLSQSWFFNAKGTTPVTYGGVLYLQHNHEVLAFDAASHRLLWRGGGLGPVHWEYPLVAGGRLFTADETGHLHAFSVR